MKLIWYSHPAGDPFWNMAVDEWLVDNAGQKRDVVFLRLYSWNQEVITIGYHQCESKAVNQSKTNGLPVIRRITGGRAVLHEPSELTYSISAPLLAGGESPLGNSIAESSRLIADGISSSLNTLGITTKLVKSSSNNMAGGPKFHTIPCFESAARFELLSNGRKVVASAQRRLPHSFLQHGSIKLTGAISHPALALAPELEGHDRQSLNGNTKDLFGATLVSFLEKQLDVKSEQVKLTACENEIIDNWANTIRQNPLSKRTNLYTELQPK